MKKEFENLKALLAGKELTDYQRKLAQNEFEQKLNSEYQRGIKDAIDVIENKIQKNIELDKQPNIDRLVLDISTLALVTIQGELQSKLKESE